MQDRCVDWSWLLGSYHDQIVASGKQPLLLLLLGLVGGFGFIRTSTRMIRAQVKWWPGNVTPGGSDVGEAVGAGLLVTIGAAEGMGSMASVPFA